MHPDNDLIIRSGTSEVVLQNVEDVPGGSVEAAGTLVLGPEVTVTLHMGPDAVFSAGLDVVIDCTQVTADDDRDDDVYDVGDHDDHRGD